MNTTTISSSRTPKWLDKKLFWIITPAAIVLIGITLLSAGLHFYKLQSIGEANSYYTAAVESMLQSWHNFFFVAAEPGGSVTVDKPPLGLWIEAIFAAVLGVEGWAVSLPNILAGIASVPLLYHLVKKYLGSAAGLIAALVIAVTPVVVAADRNNTMDGMLVFTLLLAAWAFIKATESGKLGWLLLGGFIVGLGFNIKMLQAFLPLPAFYALYFFAAKTGWGRKLLYLGLTTLLLLTVSLSWAVAVDLTPADQRPYIGSSTDNTVMELIVGHNGLNRLLGGDRTHGGNQPPNGDGQTALGPAPAADGQNLGPQAAPPDGQAFRPQAQNGQLPGPSLRGPADGQTVQPGQVRPDGPNNGNGGTNPFNNETGSPGLLRFFQNPLGKEMSWLLPFALVSLVLGLFAARLRIPLESDIHKALLIWGGWLVTCLVFFSMAAFFHAYYMIMLAPALGTVIAIGFISLWKLAARRRWLAGSILLSSAALTVGFQIYLAMTYDVVAWWMAVAGLAFAGGALLVGLHMLGLPGQAFWVRFGYATVLAAMLVVPFAWTVRTVADDDPNINLPAAYAGEHSDRGQRPATGQRNPINENLLSYLEANTQDTEYMLAVPNAFSGAPYILATGRPVLYMGGFGGGDAVVDATDLTKMVANGELRYILFNGDRQGNDQIARWAANSCTVVQEFSQSGPPQRSNVAGGPGQPSGGSTLYQCQ